jgi:uncharacterized protein (DUF885 family)
MRHDTILPRRTTVVLNRIAPTIVGFGLAGHAMKFRRHTLALTLALAAGAAAAQTDAAATRAAHDLFARQWEALAVNFPEFATYRGDFRFNDRLSDASPEAEAAQDAQARGWLAEARAIARDKLAPTDRVSLDMFTSARENEVAMQPFTGFRSLRTGALGGIQSGFSDLMTVTPVATRAQVDALMKRIAAMPRRMDQEIAAMRRGMAAGWVPSRDVLDRVLKQIDAQLAPAVEAGPLYAPFTKLGAAIPADERAALQAAGKAAIERDVIPAMRKLRAFVADEYLPKAPANGALSGYPDGPRVYEMLVRRSTTTALKPQEIHAIGQRELARLRGQMESIMTETKFAGGGFPEFVKFLNTDPRFFYPDGEQLLAGYRELSKKVDAEMPKLFAELPRMPYGVRAMPAFRGPDAAEYYDGPSRDGSRPGWFNANIAGFKKKAKWEMATLVAHEAVPGHHLQVARALELKDLPEFRRGGFGNTAFVEGWALYAETLGTEIGLYDDPYSRFGHLQWQAFRAARLVVDTGVHALGWSRQQAIDFMTERTGVERDFVSSEIDRYVSNPGQALSYMIGQLKIIELRERAKQKLGAKFDIRRFHNVVIDQGAVPLDVLEKMVDEWISAVEAGADKRPA